MQTSIRYLKDHLSEVLKAVQLGQEISVTSHRQLIAKIVPITHQKMNSNETKAAFIKQLKNLHAELESHNLPCMVDAVIDARSKERF